MIVDLVLEDVVAVHELHALPQQCLPQLRPNSQIVETELLTADKEGASRSKAGRWEGESGSGCAVAFEVGEAVVGTGEVEVRGTLIVGEFFDNGETLSTHS